MDFLELLNIQGDNKRKNTGEVKKEPLRGDKRIRKRYEYKPDIIKYLFIGESMPKGGTFFYDGNSILFDETYKAFKKHFPKITKATFLNKFKEMGFYLDDLCDEPVNHIKEEEIRKKKCELYEGDLAKRIQIFRPKLIILTPERISKNIQRAVNASGVIVQIYSLPFPARKQANKDNYLNGWKRIINSLPDLQENPDIDQ